MTTAPAMYEAIERLAASSDTEQQKGALILWLALRLAEAHRALSTIAAVTAAYERKISAVGQKEHRSRSSRSRVSP
jgi:hypothetical protein